MPVKKAATIRKKTPAKASTGAKRTVKKTAARKR